MPLEKKTYLNKTKSTECSWELTCLPCCFGSSQSQFHFKVFMHTHRKVAPKRVMSHVKEPWVSRSQASRKTSVITLLMVLNRLLLACYYIHRLAHLSFARNLELINM